MYSTGNKNAEVPRITEIIAVVIVSLVPKNGHRMLHCTEIIFPSSTAGYYCRQGCIELINVDAWRFCRHFSGLFNRAPFLFLSI